MSSPFRSPVASSGLPGLFASPATSSTPFESSPVAAVSVPAAAESPAFASTVRGALGAPFRCEDQPTPQLLGQVGQKWRSFVSRIAPAEDASEDERAAYGVLAACDPTLSPDPPPSAACCGFSWICPYCWTRRVYAHYEAVGRAVVGEAAIRGSAADFHWVEIVESSRLGDPAMAKVAGGMDPLAYLFAVRNGVLRTSPHPLAVRQNEWRTMRAAGILEVVYAARAAVEPRLEIRQLAMSSPAGTVVPAIDSRILGSMRARQAGTAVEFAAAFARFFAYPAEVLASASPARVWGAWRAKQGRACFVASKLLRVPASRGLRERNAY